jgi:hypothetical protein
MRGGLRRVGPAVPLPRRGLIAAIFVYRNIVRNLRTMKGKRQVIANTHNANVPALADAELIGAHSSASRSSRRQEQ